MATGFKINDNFDISTVNGLFVFAKGKGEIQQRIKHELLTFKGEDLNNTNRGLDVENIMLSQETSKTQRKEEIIRCLSYIEEIEVLDILEVVEDRVAKYYINLKYNNTIETITFEVQ